MSDRPVVLVTGTSRGIGEHLARHFLEREWQVVGCSRTEGAGPEHERYAHRVVDVRSEPDVVALFGFIRETYGRLDAAVNNAALNPAHSLLAMTPASAVADTFAANVVGPFVVCREAVKLMMRAKYGRIVNLGSMATRHEVPGEAAYTASKAALNALTRVLAKEVAAYGITANVVAPAAVESELMAAVDQDKLREVLARNAVTELGTPDEVAATVEWLAGADSGAVTGQVIYLGGA
jgi:3-oxoacyl-[acyl-carrier protein] reductase